MGLRVTVTLSIIAFLSVLVLSIVLGQGQGETITVDDNGDADHSSIQDAIDEASNGDILKIHEGTYVGTGFVVDKDVTIIGTPASLAASWPSKVAFGVCV